MPLSSADLPYLHELGTLTEIAKASATVRPDRTGTNTWSRFGSLTAYDLSDYQVPMPGSKFVDFDKIWHELIWFLKGDRSLKYLLDNNVTLWNKWVVPGTEVYNDAGKLIDAKVSALYPEAWRKWTHVTRLPVDEVGQFMMENDQFIKDVTRVGEEVFVTEVIDQIAMIIEMLKNSPMSRRILLSAWDPGKNHRVTLPACHPFIQFYVNEDDTLSSILYLRSSDHFIGKPYNLVQYALLTHLLAFFSGRKASGFMTMVGDQHLYSNHLDQALQQLHEGGEQFSQSQDLQRPRIVIDPNVTSIDDLVFESIKLEGYTPGPVIKAPVAQ